MEKIGKAGNIGPDVRSDCFVTFEPGYQGGLDIVVKSKVDKLYGERIRDLCFDILKFYGISDGKLTVEDKGALDFVVAARVEAAIKKVLSVHEPYLLPMIEENEHSSSKDRYRRSRLYLPGNTPKLMINAGIHKPDGIILDLEDSVAASKKEEARYIVRNALRSVDFYGAERMVRINQIPKGLDDLEHVVPHNVHLLLVPKVETADQISKLDEKISMLRTKYQFTNDIYYMPIIESALGVLNAKEIAMSSHNVVALAIGLEDYTADLGVSRTQEGRETYFARCMMVNAARAAGIQPIDSVYSDVGNMEGLAEFIKDGKSLGFDGMGCIHPRQIRVIHENYAPAQKEIDKAKRIVNAFHEAEAKGLGVVSLGSKMIDPPVVKRAQRTIDLAIRSGKLCEDWRENE